MWTRRGSGPLMAACDIHVGLRSPTMGETSGTVIRALTLGKPLVVTDAGWFSELADDVALKVSVGDREVDDLTAALRLLAERPDTRAAMEGLRAEARRPVPHKLGHVAELPGRGVRAGSRRRGGLRRRPART